MPGRTEPQARAAFLEPLRRSLSCITKAQLFVSPQADIEALRLSEDPLVLPSGTGRVQLRVRHQYRFVKDLEAPASARWHVSTVAYDYRLSRSDGAELLSWHWHPQTGLQAPHLHVARGPVPKAAHLPISLESVIRLLLTDLGVKPLRDDWSDVLTASEEPFVRHRRWHA